MMYLVIKCNELGDQWECDADRQPVCLTNDYSKYDKRGYEIYKVNEDNTFTLIRDYDTVSKEEMVIAIWNNSDFEYEEEPDKIITICEGDRENVTTSMIKKLKKEYHFSETIKEIALDIRGSGSYGEEVNGKWIVFGEKCDDYVSRGY